MKPLIVANWKMNPKTLAEAKDLFNSVEKGTKNIKKAEAVVCPPFIYIENLNRQSENLKIGAQNSFWEDKGAFTGEISTAMIKNIGCQYAIVGHSERRKYFGETDQIANKKLKAVLDAGLTPILCVGETQEERDGGELKDVLKRQIIIALEGIPSAKFSKVVMAYEPVWAIGTGNACDIEEAQKMQVLIRKIISNIYNQNLSKNIPILYGGSVNSKNAAGYVKEAQMQGLLVGGASLVAEEFVKIVKSVV